MSPVKITLSPEGASHRFIKKIGWSGIEIQIGVDEIDDAFLIRTESEIEARRILSHDRVRPILLELLRERFQLIELSENGIKGQADHLRRGRLRAGGLSARSWRLWRLSLKWLKAQVEPLRTVARAIQDGTGPRRGTCRMTVRDGIGGPERELPDDGPGWDRSAERGLPSDGPGWDRRGGSDSNRTRGVEPVGPHGYQPLQPRGASRKTVLILAVGLLLFFAWLLWTFLGLIPDRPDSWTCSEVTHNTNPT